jgi:hypothetical protein
MRRGTTPPPPDPNGTGHASGSSQHLQPLSLSILGIEPLDEFIKEVADFVHHMILTRPDIPNGKVEVEAKIGVLRDRVSGQRLGLPVLVETSTCYFSSIVRPLLLTVQFYLRFLSLRQISMMCMSVMNLSTRAALVPISWCSTRAERDRFAL